jgi:hypothetical protein
MTTTANRLRSRIRLYLKECADPWVRRMADRAIVHGWRNESIGPARYGWWAIAPTGAACWLGRSVADVQRFTMEAVT